MPRSDSPPASLPVGGLRQIVLATGLLLLGVAPAARASDQGTIDGAHFTVAPPAGVPWNGGVLLLAHGYRPETAPLVADLDPTQPAYRKLRAEGWIVAKTSYRRNGLILADAIADLDALLAHIVTRHGPARRVLIEGDSMGGTIATLIAERGGSAYHGAIAIGAALDLREPGGVTGVSLRPRLPLIFLSNRSEFEGPAAYAAGLPVEPDPDVVAPALFRVDRDGHVNVNQAERLFALRALNAWLDHGRDALPGSADQRGMRDATRPPEPPPSTAVFDADERGLTVGVTAVDPIYGNATLDLRAADLARIGLTVGLWAELRIGEETYRVRHGTDFDSVPRGQWVMLANAEGLFWLARNYGNAAATAGIAPGTAVHLRRFAR